MTEISGLYPPLETQVPTIIPPFETQVAHVWIEGFLSSHTARIKTWQIFNFFLLLKMILTGDKISRRAGHTGFEYKCELVVWGGYVEHLQKVNFSKNMPQTILKFNFRNPNCQITYPKTATIYMPQTKFAFMIRLVDLGEL